MNKRHAKVIPILKKKEMLLKKFPACIPHFTIFFIENTCPNHFKQTDSSNGRKKTSY